jgi:hypothetical protein
MATDAAGAIGIGFLSIAHSFMFLFIFLENGAS